MGSDPVKDTISKVNPGVWLLAIVLLALAVRCYHITSPLDDAHSFRQTQTAGLIRDYYRDGIDLLYPRMITLGDPGYVVLEFPVYQAVAAVLYKVFSPDVIWARLLSICFGLLSIVFVYRIARKFLDERPSIFAAFFYAFMPLDIFFQRVPIPDPLAIMLSLMMLDFLIEGIKGNTGRLVFGILAAALGIVIKSPIVAPLYLPLLYVAWRQKEDRPAAMARFFISLGIPLAALAVWQYHANAVNDKYFVKGAYPFTYLSSKVSIKLRPFNHWYFGTVSQRLDIGNYAAIGGYVVKQLLSVIGMPFAAAGIISLAAAKKGRFFFCWMLSIGITIMVFFNLYVVHNYYHLFWAPVLAIVCGAGAAWLLDISPGRRWQASIVLMLLAGFLGASLYVSERVLFQRENDLLATGKFIDEHAGKGAMIATSLPRGDAWNPTLMYYADRRGFTLPHRGIIRELVGYLREQKVGYIAVVDAGGKEFPALSGSAVVAANNRVTIYDIQHGAPHPAAASGGSNYGGERRGER